MIKVFTILYILDLFDHVALRITLYVRLVNHTKGSPRGDVTTWHGCDRGGGDPGEDPTLLITRGDYTPQVTHAN